MARCDITLFPLIISSLEDQRESYIKSNMYDEAQNAYRAIKHAKKAQEEANTRLFQNKLRQDLSKRKQEAMDELQALNDKTKKIEFNMILNFKTQVFNLEEKQQKEKNAEKARKKAEKAEIAEKERRVAKKLPKKKVFVWVLFCASIAAGILLMNTVGMDTLHLTEARNAFYDKDYETAYQLLNGRSLEEEDQLLFMQSSAILHLKHAEEVYANHLKMGKPVTALEDLMKGVKKYQEIVQAGEQDLITPDLTERYQNILKLLLDNYNLSEEGALEINALKDDYEYSLQLEALVNGEVYQSQSEIEQQEEEEAEKYSDLEDILPEEEEYLNGIGD